MRILAVSPTFFPIVGGAELLIDDVMTLLSKNNEARLITPVLPASTSDFWVVESEQQQPPYDVVRFRDRFNLLDIRGHRMLRGLIPPMSLSAIRALDSEIRRFRADILVTFFGVPYGLPSLLAKMKHHIPLIMVLCGSDVPSPRTQPVPFWSRYIRAVTDIADRSVYVSESCFGALHNREMKPGHDLVIHGGVDSSRLVERDPRGLRQRLGIDPDQLMLFTLSRLGPEKRVDVVIEAFALLRRRLSNVRLVVGGMGSELPALKELAAALGVADDVIFPGYIDEDKGDYFAASDVFVFHSLFETFGQVLAEAMFMGKPVVSVRAGAIPEVVDDGVTGIIVEPEDPASLAQVTETLLLDPIRRREFGDAGRIKAERCFTWQAQARAWADAIAFETPSRPLVRSEVEDHVA